MSKNYELMQRLEEKREFHTDERKNLASLTYAEDFPEDHPIRLLSYEALRIVQQMLLSKTVDPPHVIVLAGVSPRSGCSLTSAAVADTLVKASRSPVCLVEANFRSPGLASLFSVSNEIGLAQALVQDGPIRHFAKKLVSDNLWLLPAGTSVADTTSLLTGDRFKVRLEELQSEFEYLVIDAPPLTGYCDAISVAKHADGLILILEAESTRREAAQMVITNLRSANIPILGAVLNKRKFPIPQRLYSRM